jgi:hypothetical protein
MMPVSVRNVRGLTVLTVRGPAVWAVIGCSLR